MRKTKLWRLLNTSWETIFPVRQDYKIVSKLSLDDLLLHLQPTTYQNFISLLPFTEPAVRAVIHEAKFYSNDKAWSLLGAVLANHLKHYPSDTIVLPIPLSYRRQKARGYNQVTAILKKSQQLQPDIRLNEKVIFRTRDTQPQTSLAKTERQKNVADAFGIRDRTLPDIKNKNIIILDDVVTTGATLKAARAALAPHHPTTITCLALAH